MIPRSPVVDRLHPTPFWMKVLPRIPEALQPQLPSVGWLIGLDVDGRLVRNLQDVGGKIQRVTGARPLARQAGQPEQLALTSDFAHAIAALDLPAAAALHSGLPVEDGEQQ